VSTYPQPQPAERERRTRRADTISKHVAKSGATTYRFRVDVGVPTDRTRDRQWFTYARLAEARREYRRIVTEVAEGRFVKRDKITVAAFVNGWLDGRRDVRPNTLAGYRDHLKPVIDHLGSIPLQHLRTADLDALVTLHDWPAGDPARQARAAQRRGAGLAEGTPERGWVRRTAPRVREPRRAGAGPPGGLRRGAAA
jgi:hypothetical protein